MENPRKNNSLFGEDLPIIPVSPSLCNIFKCKDIVRGSKSKDYLLQNFIQQNLYLEINFETIRK